MTVKTAELNDTMRRIRKSADLQPLPSAVSVLIAPPLGRWPVWAGFHLPLLLRALGWPTDYVSCQRHALSHRAYEATIGAKARSACDALARTPARVTMDARRCDVEDALSDPEIEAIILVGHQTDDGIELADGVLPRHELNPLLEARSARGAFAFVSVVCVSAARRGTLTTAAPEVLPFSAPLLMPLSDALESIVSWIEQLDGRTPFDVAQQHAFVRRWSANRAEE